ncbi:NAD(P)-dependent dehydrogenase (short-subunit alcohol dehydrogenase family) [Bradyrhizobium sp. AZCC 2230]
MLRLQGKVAVVTGRSSGLGLATAQRFAREGAFVYITGRRQDELNMAIALIGDRAAAVRGDVQSLQDLDGLFDRIKSEKGKIDILVANAGFIDPEALVEVTEKNFDQTFGIIVRGLLFTVQKALPLFRDGGAIVLISSIAAFKGIPRYTTARPRQAFARSCERGLPNSRTAAFVSTRSARARSTRPSSTRRPRRRKALTLSGRALGLLLRATGLGIAARCGVQKGRSLVGPSLS